MPGIMKFNDAVTHDLGLDSSRKVSVIGLVDNMFARAVSFGQSLLSWAHTKSENRSEANNGSMTSEQQGTGASTLFLRYLLASLRYFAASVRAPLVSRNLR